MKMLSNDFEESALYACHTKEFNNWINLGRELAKIIIKLKKEQTNDY